MARVKFDVNKTPHERIPKKTSISKRKKPKFSSIYSLVVVTKEMLQNITLLTAVDCFELCDILRLKLTTYYDAPINRHVMNDGSGDLYGCICQ
jgi:hypothetical protein